MSVYIKGMEMPTSCCECFAFKSNASGYLFCRAKRLAFGKEDAEWLPKTTPNWCPIIPVPEHGRLIDADALHEELCALEYARENEWLDGVREARGVDAARVALLDAPTIIPADKEEEK